MVTVYIGTKPKKLIVIGNPAGKVDIIEYGSQQVYKELVVIQALKVVVVQLVLLVTQVQQEM